MPNLYTLHNGDCLEVLRGMDDASVDTIVTDPPYGLSNVNSTQITETVLAWVTGDREAAPKGVGFRGLAWDSFVPPPAVWDQCYRVLKPGGNLSVFAGSRMQDLMGLSVRLAGFELRDTIAAWLYSNGMPKSLDISKAIDKAAGAVRGKGVPGPYVSRKGLGNESRNVYGERVIGPYAGFITDPVTEAAKKWGGWGTGLKPGYEPIILARKPLDGTVVNNVLTHGTGGLNIDACRVPTEETLSFSSRHIGTDSGVYGKQEPKGEGAQNPAGRYPSNVLLGEPAAADLDQQSGITKSTQRRRTRAASNGGVLGYFNGQQDAILGHTDIGGASRYFPAFKYQPKAPKSERPVIEREDGTKIQHTTVKPVGIMEWVIRLTCPPGGTVLDPFAGSGTTLQAAVNEGMRPVGIELESDYIELITARMESAFPGGVAPEGEWEIPYQN